MQHKIYLDNASTTKLNKEIYNTYIKLLNEYYVNSDSLYDDGQVALDLQEKSRKAISNFFGVDYKSIIFTSGASEANNMAIKGVCFNSDKRHIITSSIEHSSVLNTMLELKNNFGFDLTILKCDKSGRINLDELKNSLKDDTCLVSIMMVNNEVGSINDIKEISRIVKSYSKALLHVDMVQALGKLDLDLSLVDLASFSAHKINGLKGSGFLYKKAHINLLPLINGGQQEFNLRGGTSNYLVNALLFKTIRLAYENRDLEYIDSLKSYLINELNKIDNIHINSPKDAISNIINFSYTKIYSEVMMNALNLKGIMVSAQSTCSSLNTSGSRVLKEIGYDDLISRTCIRVSLSCSNTIDELKYFIEILKEIISKYGI